MNYLGITIDLKRDESLTEFAVALLKVYYCRPSETSPQMAYARAAVAYCGGDLALAQRLYDYVSKGWFMFSSPILSNAPLPGEDKAKLRGLPISCFLAYVPDSLEGLIDHSSEIRWLSVKGGGVAGHWSAVRSVSDIAPGPMPFLHTIDADMTAYRQGKTRKGSYAAYMDVSHPDIIEFINMRVPTGDANRKCLNLHHAVNIPDAFMEAVENDGDWHLLDPNDSTARASMKARKLWEILLETRYRTGEPYLNFIDTANRFLNPELKAAGLEIRGSNLCNEIHLPTNYERTAVCCLASTNVEKFDEWRGSTMVEDLIEMLDNVITEFVLYAPDTLQRAKYSAMRSRDLGLGVMGLHAYYQKHWVAFDSAEADRMNIYIFDHISSLSRVASFALGMTRGSAPDLPTSKFRNAHRLAIAPNANSSILNGTSPSIEPWKANAYTHRTRAGSYLVKNKYLETVLNMIGKNTPEVWASIITNGGSIQHLDFDEEAQNTLDMPWSNFKQIFATAIEIDQHQLVRQAAARQKYICQGQSLNLFFAAGVSREELHKTHFAAWRLGCKGLYYLRTETNEHAENVSEKVERKKLEDFKEEKAEDCVACQG